MITNHPHFDFLINQSKSFSFIVFIISSVLIIIDANINIIPLNIITYIGSIILFHHKPGYYNIVKDKNPKLALSIFLYDVTVHYIPLIFVFIVYKTTTTYYPLCFAILLLYLIIFHKDLHHIYFDYERFFTESESS